MYRVLIIDDSKTVRKLLEGIFAKMPGFTTCSVASFEEAGRLLEEDGEFFAAIVDLELPDCKTAEAVNLTLVYHIHTVVLTSTMHETLRKELLEKDIVDYILKDSYESMVSAAYTVENLLLYRDERALVVYDNPTEARRVGRMLENLGFDVAHARDVEHGLALLGEREEFGIVVVHHILGEINGIRFIQHSRKLGLERMPIFFGVCGRQQQSARFNFLKNGVEDVFMEPVMKEELNVKIANALRRKEQQNQLSKYVDTINRHVITSQTDLEGNIIEVSDAFCTISGYMRTELIGRNHRIIRHPDMDAQVYERLWKSLGEGRLFAGELKNRRKDGTHYWVKAYIEPMFDKKGQKIGYSAIRYDITDKKRVEELSVTDRLTGLYNRLKLDEVFESALERVREGGELAVILLDLDKFKSVNDTYGHQVGDAVLVALAALLKELQDGMIVGRWGGEEFLIIAPDCGYEEALERAEILREKIAAMAFPTVGHKTSSFGVAAYRVGDNEESMIDRADRGLYMAKEQGRNRVVGVDM